MNIADLKLPDHGFTKAERKWLAELIAAIRTVHAVKGRGVSINNDASGQVISAEDCQPCGS